MHSYGWLAGIDNLIIRTGNTDAGKLRSVRNESHFSDRQLDLCLASTIVFSIRSHLLTLSLQVQHLEKSKVIDSQGKNSPAMFRCVVRLEIKGCDLVCDGIGYGGDRNVIQQGLLPIAYFP